MRRVRLSTAGAVLRPTLPNAIRIQTAPLLT